MCGSRIGHYLYRNIIEILQALKQNVNIFIIFIFKKQILDRRFQMVIKPSRS